MKTIYKCYPGGKHKALTMSYDDGRIADRRLVSLFNKYGIKGTFFINSGRFDHVDRVASNEIKELYKGHEVAVHTLTHPTIARCPQIQVAQEVIADRINLESLVGYPVRGMSYPNGSYNSEIQKMLPHLGIEYARIVGNSNEFSEPVDLFTWKATCHHNANLINLVQSFIAFLKTQYLQLMYVWGHSYEFDNDNNWELIEEFCELAGSADDIWYATNIEIVDYTKAYHHLQFAADCSFVYNPSVVSVWLSSEGEIIEIPGGSKIML